MSKSICWLYLDENGRVDSITQTGEAIHNPLQSDDIVPFDEYPYPPLGPIVMVGALWDATTQELVFDAGYEEKQAELNGIV